jgi:hypothetical protein
VIFIILEIVSGIDKDLILAYAKCHGKLRCPAQKCCSIWRRLYEVRRDDQPCSSFRYDASKFLVAQTRGVVYHVGPGSQRLSCHIAAGSLYRDDRIGTLSASAENWQ